MQPNVESFTDLIRQCMNGDQAAYAALYDLCAPRIYRLCYGLLMNRQDAEDVMQDSFAYAFRCLARYDPARASFITWLYTIALSRCRNAHRRRPWLRIAAFLPIDLPAPRRDWPDERLADRDARSVVTEALKGLTPRLREAIVLRYGQGLSFREMADVLGCPQKTAESRVRLAHDQLRARLSPTWHSLLDDMISSGG